MLVEVESAANFLSELLSRSRIEEHQLTLFKQTIIECLIGHYQKHWFPEKPFKGSAYRCLRINQKMDPMVARAAQKSGLHEQLLRNILPKELTLWVDPKEVSYRIGENGSICVIYEDNDNSSGNSSLSSNSSVSSSPTNQFLSFENRIYLNSFLS